MSGGLRGPKVAIVLVNWNGLVDTRECLRSISLLDFADKHAVVVDNASRNDEASVLEHEFPSVTVIRSTENRGFAGGCNLGIAWALDHGFHYVFLLNNDTVIVQPEMLSLLVGLAEDDGSIGAVGPKIVFHAEPGKIWFAGGEVHPKTGRVAHVGWHKPAASFAGVRPTQYVTGCALLAKASVLREVGPLDDSYFLYYEETDWCLRVRHAGYRLCIHEDAVVHHKVGRSTKVSDTEQYYMQRNRLLFVRRWAGAWFWFPALPLTLVRSLGEVAVGKGSYRGWSLRTWWLANRDAARGRKGKRPAPKG